jgi:integrase/recombinase XerD
VASSGMANGNEGSTPALGDGQARKLLEAPPADTLRGVRDRANLTTLLYHGIRQEELSGLRIRDIHSARASCISEARERRGKIRFVPYAMAQRLTEECTPPRRPWRGYSRPRALSGNEQPDGRAGKAARSRLRLPKYRPGIRLETGISAEPTDLYVDSLRATSVMNALSHEADIAKVQKWLGPRECVDYAPLRPAEEPTRG